MRVTNQDLLLKSLAYSQRKKSWFRGWRSHFNFMLPQRFFGIKLPSHAVRQWLYIFFPQLQKGNWHPPHKLDPPPFHCNWYKVVRFRYVRVFFPIHRRFRYSSRTMNWEWKVWGGQSIIDYFIPSEASIGAPRNKCQTIRSTALFHPAFIYIAPQANSLPEGDARNGQSPTDDVFQQEWRADLPALVLQLSTWISLLSTCSQ